MIPPSALDHPFWTSQFGANAVQQLRDEYDTYLHGRGRHVTRERQQRIMSALCRLSRERWILPLELSGLALRLAKCCSSNPHGTVASLMNKGILPKECIYAVGMLNGEPPLYTGQSGYADLVALTTKLQRRRGLSGTNEIALLELLTKERGTK